MEQAFKTRFLWWFWYVLALDTNHEDKFKKFPLKPISHHTLSSDTFIIPKDMEKRLKKANSIQFGLI